MNAERHTAMPQAFLMQQMQWRECLEEAHSVEQVQALEREVATQEREFLDTLTVQLGEPGDPPSAADTVRALMFLERFRTDIDRRLESLEQGSSH